jgi:hypothetical protein
MNYKTRSEHRDTIRNSPLTFEVTQKIDVRTEFDIVAYFNSFNVSQQAAYWGSEPNSGYTDYERPIVYLIEDAEQDTEVNEPFMASDFAISIVDTDEVKDRVVRSHGESVHGFAGEWSEHHCAVLLDHVEWMRPPVEKANEDQAREPGPLDVALF